MTEQYNQVCGWHKKLGLHLRLKEWLKNDIRIDMFGPKTSSHHYLLDMSKQGFSINHRNCGIINPPLTT